MDASTPPSPKTPATPASPPAPIPKDTKPIAFLLGLLLAVILILAGGLVWALPQFWIDGITIATATAGFFTAMFVRVRRSFWWWFGIGCAMSTMMLLAAQHATWIPCAIWN